MDLNLQLPINLEPVAVCKLKCVVSMVKKLGLMHFYTAFGLIISDLVGPICVYIRFTYLA